MQHRTGNFASEMKKYVNENFVSDISRLDFLKNFEDWPSPNNESWRLSRLGKLSRNLNALTIYIIFPFTGIMILTR